MWKSPSTQDYVFACSKVCGRRRLSSEGPVVSSGNHAAFSTRSLSVHMGQLVS